MKRSLRYLAFVLVLGAALMMAGCFDNPGESLIGTWVGTAGTGTLTVSLGEMQHYGLVMAHANIYTSTITYTDPVDPSTTADDISLTWQTGPLSGEDLQKAASLIGDYLTNGGLPEGATLPDLYVTGWGVLVDFDGNVTDNKFVVYAPDIVRVETTIPVAMVGTVSGDTITFEQGMIAGQDCTGLTLTRVVPD